MGLSLPRTPFVAVYSRGSMLTRTHRPPQATRRWSARSTPPSSETTWTGSTEPPGRSAGSREDAEDLVQETYARVLSRPRFLRNEDDLGYLLRALRNTFLTRKRTESRRLRPGPLPDQLDLVRRSAGARAAGRARGRRALRRGRRAPGRLPRRPRRRRHHRPLLQGGGRSPADSRGNGDEPSLPRASAGRAPRRRGRLAAGVDGSDEHLLA